MRNLEQLRLWLSDLKKAWENKEPNSAVNLFSENVVYYENPTTGPLKSKEELMRVWQEIISQKNIRFSYEILYTSDEAGVVSWKVSFVQLPSNEKVNICGVYFLKFDVANKCCEFRQWWQEKKD